MEFTQKTLKTLSASQNQLNWRKNKMRRTKRTQTKHNKTVRRVASGFKSQGWKVKADVSGYSSPRTIGGRQPDVVAIKGSKTRVVEVETPNSYKKDAGQRKVFRDWASRSSDRKFRTKKTK